MSNAESSIRVTICNQKGLHARASAKFIKTVGAYDAKVQVSRVNWTGLAEGSECYGPVNGSSLLGLMLLAADNGTEIQISASGNQSSEVLQALTELKENKFGEDINAQEHKA